MLLSEGMASPKFSHAQFPMATRGFSCRGLHPQPIATCPEIPGSSPCGDLHFDLL